MNPIKRKMASFLTEAVHKEIDALSPDSPCTKELNEIEDVDTIIADEITKICNEATLGEITKASLLARRLRIVSVQEKDSIKNDLNRMAEKLIKRAESKSGSLRLSKIYQQLFSEF